MTQTLNNEAPPAPVSGGQDFLKFEPFPASDSYVLTLVGTNYIASHPFERTDDNGKDFIKEAPAIEFFWGGMADGKPYFTKSWPQAYSLHEKANYAKIYKALTGKIADASQRPKDMLGKAAMVEIKLENKKSKKGKDYVAVKIGAITAVPKLLLGSVVPLEQLEAPFKAALAKANEKTDENNTPF